MNKNVLTYKILINKNFIDLKIIYNSKIKFRINFLY
jgi:hypothetical protein